MIDFKELKKLAKIKSEYGWLKKNIEKIKKEQMEIEQKNRLDEWKNRDIRKALDIKHEQLRKYEENNPLLIGQFTHDHFYSSDFYKTSKCWSLFTHDYGTAKIRALYDPEYIFNKDSCNLVFVGVYEQEFIRFKLTIACYNSYSYMKAILCETIDSLISISFSVIDLSPM